MRERSEEAFTWDRSAAYSVSDFWRERVSMERFCSTWVRRDWISWTSVWRVDFSFSRVEKFCSRVLRRSTSCFMILSLRVNSPVILEFSILKTCGIKTDAET